MNVEQQNIFATEELKFSYNWNDKLTAKRFTTLRMKQEKYQVGSVFKVSLKGGSLYNATVIAIKEFASIYDIDEFSASLDTGYGAEETIKIVETMYKNKDIDLKTKPFLLLLVEPIREKKKK